MLLSSVSGPYCLQHKYTSITTRLHTSVYRPQTSHDKHNVYIRGGSPTSVSLVQFLSKCRDHTPGTRSCSSTMFQFCYLSYRRTSHRWVRYSKLIVSLRIAALCMSSQLQVKRQNTWLVDFSSLLKGSNLKWKSCSVTDDLPPLGRHWFTYRAMCSVMLPVLSS